MKLNAVISLLIAIVGLPAFASGSKVGNGGSGVSCPGHHVELLDLYEIRENDGFLPMWTIGSMTIEEEIARYREQLEFILPKNHPFIMNMNANLDLLLATMEVVDSPLPKTLDEGFTHVRPECSLVQIALRGDGIFLGRLQITNEFWNSATLQERTLLLIHEAAHDWFTEMVPTPADDTKAIRQFVGLLSEGAAYSPKMTAVLRTIVETSLPVSDDVIRSLR